MKWFTKVRNWWYEQNDVDAVAAVYRQRADRAEDAFVKMCNERVGYGAPITDEEMARQDEAVCPSDTPSSVALKNGKLLWSIWGAYNALNGPQTARIEFHGESDEHGMAEALRRFDEARGIVRDKSGEPMPAMTAVVQTNRGGRGLTEEEYVQWLEQPREEMLIYGHGYPHHYGAVENPGDSKRPSRGTEEVPVRRILQEEQNARVPHNRQPKHSRGHILQPGQVGMIRGPKTENEYVLYRPGGTGDSGARVGYN